MDNSILRAPSLNMLSVKRQAVPVRSQRRTDVSHGEGTGAHVRVRWREGDVSVLAQRACGEICARCDRVLLS